MKLINQVLDKIDTTFAYIASAFLFLLMIWIFLDSFLRSVFNFPIVGTIEIIGEYFLVIIVYLSISYAFKHDSHVSVDFLEHKFSPKMAKILRVFNNLLAFAAFLVLGIVNFQKGLEYFAKDIRSVSLLDYPLAPAVMVITFGVLILCVRLLVDSANIILGTKKD